MIRQKVQFKPGNPSTVVFVLTCTLLERKVVGVNANVTNQFDAPGDLCGKVCVSNQYDIYKNHICLLRRPPTPTSPWAFISLSPRAYFTPLPYIGIW